MQTHLAVARWPAVVAIGGLLGVLARLYAPSADANHIWQPHNHVATINTFNPEDFCVWLEEDDYGNVLSTMDFTTAWSRIHDTLTIDNPSENWNVLQGGKVQWIGGGPTPCDEQPSRTFFDIEYWVRDDTTGPIPQGCGGTSCAWPHGDYTYDPLVDHSEYQYYTVRFKTAHINHADPGGAYKPWHHAINHETGHVLGLKDPDYIGDCPESQGGEASVMHSQFYYGCTVNLEWPSASDRASVQSEIPPPSPIANGFIKGGGIPPD